MVLFLIAEVVLLFVILNMYLSPADVDFGYLITFKTLKGTRHSHFLVKDIKRTPQE